jgi:hypothetical protein
MAAGITSSQIRFELTFLDNKKAFLVLPILNRQSNEWHKKMYLVASMENNFAKEKSCILSTNLQDLQTITRSALTYRDEGTHGKREREWIRTDKLYSKLVGRKKCQVFVPTRIIPGSHIHIRDCTIYQTVRTWPEWAVATSKNKNSCRPNWW